SRPNIGPDGIFDAPALFQEMSFSAPRLYLANGVTTIRTAGSAEIYTDLKLKRAIEKGVIPGPHLDVTGPYLNGPGNPNLQIPELKGPEDARETVAYWADRGVTSFKAYAQITREELNAAVKEAHKRGLKVMGHLCSVTYEEAAEIGIDNLEHGFSANTALDPGKKPDTCSDSGGDYTLKRMIPGSAEANRLIATLIGHHVAVTSTLPGRASSLLGTEASVDGRPLLRAGVLEAMSPSAREAYLYSRNRPADKSAQAKIALLLRREMDMERAFVAAGGLLLAGPGPGGGGGVISGVCREPESEVGRGVGVSPAQTRS